MEQNCSLAQSVYVCIQHFATPSLQHHAVVPLVAVGGASLANVRLAARCHGVAMTILYCIVGPQVSR